jgi:hypothetical protein
MEITIQLFKRFFEGGSNHCETYIVADSDLDSNQVAEVH